MQVSYNGSTSSFQVESAGPIPVTCFLREQMWEVNGCAAGQPKTIKMTLMSRRCMDGQIKVRNDLNKTVYYAAVAELADAWDLKFHSSIGVRVRFPSAAFRNRS